jgi:aminoglycoside phosphotransferase (APT) family kinase protein
MDLQDHETLLQADPVAFARLVLVSLGLPASPLRVAGSWSNHVWLAPQHVVRISSGRFRDAFLHERKVLGLLPDTIPHAEVVAHGRVGLREWMVLRRIRGRPLIQVWSTLSQTRRRAAARQMGSILQAFHAIRPPEGFHNPSVVDALSPTGNRRDLYHAPPEHYQLLVDAAIEVQGVDRAFLDDVASFIAERLITFKNDRSVLVHLDFHLANMVWEGDRIMALLDFEGTRLGPADMELDTLLRSTREPQPYLGRNPRQDLTADAFAAIPRWMASTYPALFDHPNLRERLEVYDALWQLVTLLHFPPGPGRMDPWGALHSLLAHDNHWARFQASPEQC